jgi:hypothetical protein
VNTSDDRYLEACLPPWQRFPVIIADELVQHLEIPDVGVAPPNEAASWFQQVWRPFWSQLDWEQRERYLLRWRASLKWRMALVLLHDRSKHDPTTNGIGSPGPFAIWRPERTRQKKPPLWHRSAWRPR